MEIIYLIIIAILVFVILSLKFKWMEKLLGNETEIDDKPNEIEDKPKEIEDKPKEIEDKPKETKKIEPTTKLKIDVDLENVNVFQRNINKYIDYSIASDFPIVKLQEFCSMALKGGKRVRPVIILSILKSLMDKDIKNDKDIENDRDDPDYGIAAAISVEYIHCSSLILDDIMDGDEERRGNKCIHTVAGIDIAQLTSVALFSKSYQKICESFRKVYSYLESNNITPNYKTSLMMFDYIGDNVQKLGEGQLDDITIPTDIKGKDLDEIKKSAEYNKKIMDLISKKTSSLFEICFIYPYVLANSDKSTEEIEAGLKDMKEVARLFGLLFQISDDFEDVEQDLQRDGEYSIMNFAIYKGLSTAKEEYYKIEGQFRECAKKINVYTPEINEIVNYMNKRVELYYNYLNKKN